MHRLPTWTLKPWVQGFLDALFPRTCLGCGKSLTDLGAFHYLCAECRAELHYIEPPCCVTCGAPFYGVVESSRSCVKCHALEPAFTQGRALLHHRDLGAELVRALKYARARHLAPDIIRLIRRMPGLSAFTAGATLVPVPLHPSRERQRGFNQSHLLAHCLAIAAGADGAPLPILNALRRTRPTAQQTRLPREKRLRNVKNAFALAPSVRLEVGTPYILVDDVFTTGATLDACARPLLAAGASELRVWTLTHG